jgi:putative transposase
VFASRHLVRLEDMIRDVCVDFETELKEFNGERNHAHLLVNFPPKVVPIGPVNALKGVSSRRMRQEFPDLSPHYCRARRPIRLLLRRIGRLRPLAGPAPSIEQQNRPA